MDDKNKTKGQAQIGIPLGQMDILPGEVKQRHLVPNPVRSGDVYYGDNGNFKSVAIGTAYQILMVVNKVPTWVTFPQTGVHTSRPTSGRFVGDQYYAIDNFVLSIWNGAVWKSVTLS